MIPVFYMLPRIHKSLIEPKGRPIVASNDSLLELLSNFVDHFIKPYVLKLPSYINDSTDDINKISEIKDLPGEFFSGQSKCTKPYKAVQIYFPWKRTRCFGFLPPRSHRFFSPSKCICELASLIYISLNGTDILIIPACSAFFKGKWRTLRICVNSEWCSHWFKIPSWIWPATCIFLLICGFSCKMEASSPHCAGNLLTVTLLQATSVHA